ncbi:CAP domain-containing protein [Oceanitalea stevensii]|uniref:SCP domain-containing protein n=1 Tax=Oceanitalea stevensii TaxID=2763072 RepID=A0ABR8Z4X7_9MICO|nr:CAP domain-containing protein [Oceanitalea stevensii]MBD8063401.1 hypothetical protein [Oceanitalea stevensii]
MPDPHMRWRHCLVASLLPLLLLPACGGPQDGAGVPTGEPSATAGPTRTSDPAAYAADLIELTNETREEEGLPGLKRSDCAETAALERAHALVGQGELVHAPMTPVIDQCAPATTAAENLVNSTAQPIDVVKAWLGSPGHRANIIDPDLTEIGIGCVPDGVKLLCSQVFLGP